MRHQFKYFIKEHACVRSNNTPRYVLVFTVTFTAKYFSLTLFDTRKVFQSVQAHDILCKSYLGHFRQQINNLVNSRPP